MNRTTDEAAAEARRAARDRAEAERLAMRAFHRAEGRRRIVAAGGFSMGDLSGRVRRILGWLADWDEPTIEGVVELVAASRKSAAGTGCGHRP